MHCKCIALGEIVSVASLILGFAKELEGSSDMSLFSAVINSWAPFIHVVRSLLLLPSAFSKNTSILPIMEHFHLSHHVAR